MALGGVKAEDTHPSDSKYGPWKWKEYPVGNKFKFTLVEAESIRLYTHKRTAMLYALLAVPST